MAKRIEIDIDTIDTMTERELGCAIWKILVHAGWDEDSADFFIDEMGVNEMRSYLHSHLTDNQGEV